MRALAPQLLSLALLAAAACGGGKAATQVKAKTNRWGRPIPATADKPPAWVDNAPKSSRQRVYAIGYSGPTFWPQDALANAAEDARGKLALSLTSRVEQLTLVNAGTGSQLDLTKEATDLVMQNSRIEASWPDEIGARGEAGGVFALAVLDFDAMKAGPASAAGTRPGGAPGWLDRLPSSPSRLYAAGYSGPSFRAEDALANASDVAVQNLAASLRSRVQAYSLIVETASGMSVDEFSHTANPDEEFLEIVRKKAKVEQVWVDKEGVWPGDPPGAVWALASIEVVGKGGYRAVDNEDLGPALDRKGNATDPAPAQPPKP